MRFNPIPLTAIMLVLSIVTSAQDSSRYTLQLKSGAFIPAKNIPAEKLNSLQNKSQTFFGKTQLVIQFEELPNQLQQQQLKDAGIELIEYISGNAYTAIVKESSNTNLLSTLKARAVLQLTPIQKLEPQLASGNYPAWAVKTAGTVDVLISYPKSFTSDEVKSVLLQNNFDIISYELKGYNILGLRVAVQRLEELASLPIITYVQAVGGEPIPLNNVSKENSRGHVLSASAGIGRNLKGEGVTVGIGDQGDAQHIDFSGRKITRNAGFLRYHSTHVSGIVAGSGIWNELFTGYAPKAKFISQDYAGIINNAPAYVTDYSMVITNNSWGNTEDSGYHGRYDFYSAMLDQQAFSLPNLQHVFAAGNSGNTIRPPYPSQFGTVLGAHQSAKNIITVGNVRPIDTLYFTSSRGPVRDGRIKPEVTAQGTEVNSTATSASYLGNTGTSMAAPAVTGGLTLLYQRYRQLNGSLNPPNALMKAVLCNTADDKGNPGPDYTYGFGRINLLRAVQALENTRYTSGTISTGGATSFNITVPVNTAILKVMLYWNDPAAAQVAAKALVNNLDLTVTTTTPLPVATHLPLVLNINPASVNVAALPGIDTLNNIEQVTINNPPDGTYTVNISGTSVPVNTPQQYFVVYDIVRDSTILTFPVGGERLLPGETDTLTWDSYGGNPETFDVEYSLDNGSNWNVGVAGVSSNKRQTTWTVPAAAATKEALVRVKKNNTPQVSTSANFTIIGVPVVSLAPTADQCEGYIKITWPAVPNATQYEVMKLQGDEMQSIAIVPNTTLDYTFSGLSKDTVYWVTVRSIYNSSLGRRAFAAFRQPNSGSCTGSISDNDVKMDLVVSPSPSGRLLTSTALPASIPLTVRIKNLDDAVSNAGLTFSYSINGGAIVTDPAVTPTINAGATYDYTFAAPINLSAAGTYSIEITVTRTGGDPVTSNNIITKVFKQLNNPLVTLPFTDNLEAAADQTVIIKQVGLQGSDRYDFVNTSNDGRLRTVINSGMAYSGIRAITLDAGKYVGAGNVDSLTGTFNLAAFDTAVNDIRLDFRYKNHGQSANAANKLWIRGSDLDNWIEAYDLAANQNEADGTYKLSASIQLSDLLKTALPHQNYSTSFQARWGQFGNFSAADNNAYNGYTFDDVQLYEVTDDLFLVSIDTPIVNSCNLNAITPVKITVRNNSETTIPASPGIPVRYRINNGGWINETITTAIAANISYQYTFSTTVNLSANSNYLIETEVVYPSDTYQANDTLSTTITNTPTIAVTNTSPYLQGFEADNGYWYTSGKNNSWEYGTPASYKINRAANGSKAWKTSKAGNYKDSEKSYLYSPCFDITALTNPTLSLSIALDLEDCGSTFLCDGAYAEYSIDGKTWSRLGANGNGTNWYNKTYAGNNLWSVQNYTRWHVATLPLSVLPAPQSQYTRVQFRFVVTADPLVTREGMAIDDIHIYSNPYGIYDVTGISPVTTLPSVNGNNWVDFVQAGKIIASVNPDGQVLGNTDVQSFINTGGVRYNSNQYYHDRDITIKPANNTLSDSCTVRFYFLDAETEALLNATGCGTCYKPSMAYELGVSKYSDANDFYEDGIVENGLSGIWLFINSAKVQKIPYDKGYYAQFRVKDFSEFWLNNGGFNLDHPLPLQLISFTAKKTANGKDAVAEWVTASEFNINRFEIEVARSQQEYQRNEFTKIGSVNSNGNSSTEQRYSFIDVESNKTGARYYRLKIIENDGKISYSATRPVLFNADMLWTIQPNPSSGIFHLALQAASGQLVNINVTDMSGKLVHHQQIIASGFLQKAIIDLNNIRFASGLYLLDASTADGVKQQFKLIKQ
jgi:hypothetical protein